MILPDHEIAHLCGHEFSYATNRFVPVGWDEARRREGLVHPFTAQKTSFAGGKRVPSYGLSECGYDLTLSRRWKVMLPGDDPIDPGAVDPDDFAETEADHVVVPPQGFVLAASVEQIAVPDDLVGFVSCKSSHVRCGLFCPPTVLEPGWRGHVTLEFANHSPRGVVLRSGVGAVQVIFARLVQVVRKPYSGKYQNQGAAPQEAIP